VTVLLALAAASLFGVGTYLVLQRQLSRIVIGVGLLGHGTNVLFVIAARGRGAPPFVPGDGTADPADYTDPLPQALALTAIVITFGVTAFLLALAYRSWIVTRHDEVEDDVEDRFIARRALRHDELEGEGGDAGEDADADTGEDADAGGTPAAPAGAPEPA
jgi:multicomponent Na+:H+ antiporter subunit C